MQMFRSMVFCTLAAAPVAANASEIVQSFSFSTNPTFLAQSAAIHASAAERSGSPYLYENGSSSTTLNFARFDPALGTLQHASFAFNVRVYDGGGVSIVNPGGTLPGDVLQLTVNRDFYTEFDGTPYDLGFYNPYVIANCTPRGSVLCIQQFSLTETRDFDLDLTGVARSATTDHRFDVTSVFSNTVQGLVQSPQSVFTAQSRQEFTIAGTLTYTYLEAITTGVPEPSAWALLILGFSVTGASLRRRKIDKGRLASV